MFTPVREGRIGGPTLATLPSCLTDAPRRLPAAVWRRAGEALDRRRWLELAQPIPRAAARATRAWRGSPGATGPTTVMPDRPDLALVVGAFVDEVVASVHRAFSMPRPAQEVRRGIEEAVTALGVFERHGWLDDPARYHRAPPPPTGLSADPTRAGSLDYTRVAFDSGYEPHPDEPGRQRWLSYEANRTAHAWMLRHDEPRPWIVCVHGALMGYPVVDFTAFRAGWLHHRLGLNVVLPVLPLHGPRRAGPWHSIGFPVTEDPLDTVHGVAQAAWDVRRLLAWIRAETDEPIGLYGLSLGGHTAALVAGLDADLACVIVGIPVVDISELFGGHLPDRILRRADYEELTTAARRLLRVVSPLAIPPAIPPERRFIFAGLGDRLVHPRHQVEQLWDHWGEPTIGWYHGGHAGFFRSPPMGRFVRDALEYSLLGHGPDQRVRSVDHGQVAR